ncbi:MAG: LON peptidase substrate-binding domain-containing protein [Bacteroidota bacterium]
MNTLLPLFPLQLVAFPGEALNLHIFEPRYRQLIQEAESTGQAFGIPAFIEGRLQTHGTEMELLSIEKVYANGKMDVKTRGIRVFRMQEFFETVPEKLYAGGQVEYVDNSPKGDIILSKKIVELLEELYQFMDIKKPIPAVEDVQTFDLGHHVGFTLEQEYKMLQLSDEVDRQELMLNHLKRLIPTVRQMEDLRKRVQMNGHFKDLIPPM